VSEPQFPAGLPVAYARNDNARAIIAGFASAMPALSVMWQQVDRALADVPALGAIIARLTAELAVTRMDRANLLAAMCAALGAHVRGEDETLWYLRDELDAQQERSGRGGRAS
jgi:hypothetical protein